MSAEIVEILGVVPCFVDKSQEIVVQLDGFVGDFLKTFNETIINKKISLKKALPIKVKKEKRVSSL